MKSIELLLEEYKIISDIAEKYFDRMYSTINFVLIYYGAILTIVFNIDNKDELMLFCLHIFFLSELTF